MGEAGLVEHSSAEAKSLKLKAKGLSGCHPSGQQPRHPDGGARGPNKGLLSQQFTKRTQSLKQLWLEGQFGKRQPAKEIMTEKRKTLTLCSNLEVAGGCDVGVDEVSDE